MAQPHHSPAALPPDIRWPEHWAAGVIVASPHSGREYPDWFLSESILDPLTLRSSEDAFVDRLIAPALEAGAVLLTARAPRCLVDVNRAAGDLDPQAVEDVPRRAPDPRIQSGLGVIPRVVARGRAIRAGRLSRAEAQRRIDMVWSPYHAALDDLMNQAVARHGRAVLIDVHSMPHDAVSHLPGPLPQIVLGDLNGLSASRALRAEAQRVLAAQGFTVAVNAPFAGAHIASAYGRPGQGRHVLQIEIDRSAYMDEARIVPHAGYDAFAERCGAAIRALAGGDVRSLAAE